jgi:hypothetical protein
VFIAPTRCESDVARNAGVTKKVQAHSFDEAERGKVKLKVLRKKRGIQQNSLLPTQACFRPPTTREAPGGVDARQ